MKAKAPAETGAFVLPAECGLYHRLPLPLILAPVAPMKHLALIIALAVFSTAAFAEGVYQNANELRLVPAVSLIIEDGVDDGCLSNPNALKVEAELILRRSGISVDVRDLLGPQYFLQISPFGFEIGQSGSCTVTLVVELWRFAQAPEGHTAIIIAWTNGHLFTGGTRRSATRARSSSRWQAGNEQTALH